MSASGQSIGGDATIRSPHNAPRNMRHETIQELAGCKPLHPVTRSHGLAARNDHASFNPAIGYPVGQREGRLSETFPTVDGRAAQAGSLDAGQGSGLSHSFSTRSALKLAQFAQTMLDIASILLIALFIILLFASPFIALGCLLFF